MAELSATTGVPIATIKYYLREGLLPRGELSGPNQASYDERHVKRLRLIRALIEVGGISVAGAVRVIEAIDSDRPIEETFGIAQHTASEEVDPETLDPEELQRIDTALSGWAVSPDNPGRLAAARALTAFAAAGQHDARGWLDRYVQAALTVAEADLDEIDAREGRQEKAELVVVGTALGDALFSGLRRAAQEHVSVHRYFRQAGAPPGSPDPSTPPTPPENTQEQQ